MSLCFKCPYLTASMLVGRGESKTLNNKKAENSSLNSSQHQAGLPNLFGKRNLTVPRLVLYFSHIRCDSATAVQPYCSYAFYFRGTGYSSTTTDDINFRYDLLIQRFHRTKWKALHTLRWLLYNLKPWEPTCASWRRNEYRWTASMRRCWFRLSPLPEPST